MVANSIADLNHAQSRRAMVQHQIAERGVRDPLPGSPIDELLRPRLERAIGVIYRPETELQSHYFEAVLPKPFDEYIGFDQARAVTPLGTETLQGLPDTYPFGV